MTSHNYGPGPSSTPDGMSNGKKVGLACGGCAVVGLIVLLIIAVVVFAVGSDGDSQAEPQKTPSASATPSPSDTQTEEPEESEPPTPSPTRSSSSPTPSPSSSPTPTPTTPSPTTDGETVVVSRVIDGDTVVLANGDRVRLLGMDAPERGECHFGTATQRMRELVEGKEVVLDRDGNGTDRYERLLGYIDVDGVDAGYTLIEEGLANARYDSQDGYGHHTRQSEYRATSNATAHQTCAAPIPTPEPEPAPEANPEPPAGDNCDPNYRPCIPVYPPDINCSDIDFRVEVITGYDPHNLDADGDGIGCEANG